MVVDDTQSNSEDSSSPRNSPNNFSYTILPTIEDAGMFCALIAFAGLFLYSFIKYLKRSPTRTENPTDTTDNLDIINIDGSIQDRRFRFGRLRSNSRHKAWLESLDPFDTHESLKYIDDIDNIHDADRLIQSDISPETVMRELDPMGTSSKQDSVGALHVTNQRRLIQCEMKEWLGIGLAAGTSIFFMFIFSNIEE